MWSGIQKKQSFLKGGFKMGLNIRSFILGPLMTNAYLLWDEASGHGVIVDPGTGPDQLVKAIAELKLTIDAILLTHAHFDHIGGVEDVRQATNAPVYIHEKEAAWLTDPQQNGSSRFGGGVVRAGEADIILSGTEKLTLLGREVAVLHTPGHSPGSVSYYWSEEQLIVSGDVLFQGSIGRTDLPEGDYETLMASIETLTALPEQTAVYPGHGPKTTLEAEQHANPFLSGLM